MEEYKKSLDDTIDWTIIDQLHAATARFSSACTEVKKIYVSALAVIVPLITQLSAHSQGKPQLSHPVFISVYIATVVFWFLDSYCYYYQELLRSKMKKKFDEIKARNQRLKDTSINLQPNTDKTGNDSVNSEEVDKVNENEPLPDDRTKEENRSWRSITNSSMSIYFAAFLINTISYILFCLEKI